MRRGRDVIGIPVLETGSGRALGSVVDLLFRRDGAVRALLVSPVKGIFRRTHAVSLDAFDALDGEGARISREKLVENGEAEYEGVTVRGEQDGLCGRRLLTDKGKELGTVADVILEAAIDPGDGKPAKELPATHPPGAMLLWGFEVSDGIVKDLLDGRPVVEAAGAYLADGAVILGPNGAHMNLEHGGHASP